MRELKEQAGIGESRTLDGWRLKLESDPDALGRAAAGEQARPVPTVMVLDEAGMAGTREAFGQEQAVLICRDNERREPLNGLARERRRQLGELGEGVVIAGREWCVGERVIARRNDRGRDLDNGTRGTVTDVDTRDGLRIRTDSGAIRQVDGECASQHLEYAYALTGHGMQGGTVEWAAVIGRPGDFTRNWSYTALSRAREPTEILLVDEPTQAQADRAAIAPFTDLTTLPLARMANRMGERDDEDLALEQLEQIEQREHDERPAEESRHENIPSPAASELSRLRELTDELDQVKRQLAELPMHEVKSFVTVEATIASLTAERARITHQRGWREREIRRFNLDHTERRLAEQAELRRVLLERIGDAEVVTEQARQLQERRRELSTEHEAARGRLIAHELDCHPEWLTNALGPEPPAAGLQGRWQRTARELAGYRLDHQITDPEQALGTGEKSTSVANAARRALTDTRRALGLDTPGPEHGTGHEIG